MKYVFGGSFICKVRRFSTAFHSALLSHCCCRPVPNTLPPFPQPSTLCPTPTGCRHRQEAGVCTRGVHTLHHPGGRRLQPRRHAHRRLPQQGQLGAGEEGGWVWESAGLMCRLDDGLGRWLHTCTCKMRVPCKALPILPLHCRRGYMSWRRRRRGWRRRRQPSTRRRHRSRPWQQRHSSTRSEGEHAGHGRRGSCYVWAGAVAIQACRTLCAFWVRPCI